MTVLEWLESAGRDGRKAIDYLAELVAVNGGNMQVTNFGTVNPDPALPYGRRGLTPLEALHLQELRGTLQGFLLATDNAHADEVRSLVQRTITAKRPGILVPSPDDIRRLRL